MANGHRKDEQMNKQPGHYTESGTRKYQANGPQEWSRTFQAAAGKRREGEGIRAALAYAAGHKEAFLAWVAKHPAEVAPATRAEATRAARVARAGKAAKPKAPKAAKAKAPKAGKPKAPKAAKPKAPKAAKPKDEPAAEGQAS